jgi:hypothetical protein
VRVTQGPFQATIVNKYKRMCRNKRSSKINISKLGDCCLDVYADPPTRHNHFSLLGDMRFVKHYGRIETSVFDSETVRRTVRNVKLRGDNSLVAKDLDTWYFFHGSTHVDTVSTFDHPVEGWDYSSKKRVVMEALKCRATSSTTTAIFHDNLKVDDDFETCGLEIVDFRLRVTTRPTEMTKIMYEPDMYDALIIHFSAFKDVTTSLHLARNGHCDVVCKPLLAGVTIQSCREAAERAKGIVQHVSAVGRRGTPGA